MKKCGIYMITNPNKRIYIGLSTDIESRWRAYKHLCNIKTQKLLYRSMKKYGYDAHNFKILEECNVDSLSDREIFWIQNKKSYFYENKKIGLNLTKGGDYPPKQTKPKTKEHRKKISQANKGRKHSKETIEKIRKARAKQIFSKESIEKRAKKLRGRVSKLKGRKRPNISEKLKGRKTAISIKCVLTNMKTGEIIKADSIMDLCKMSGISYSSIFKMKKGQHPKKYKHFKYEERR